MSVLMTATAAPGRKISEINAEMDEWYDQQPMHVSCSLEGCDWKWDGPAVEGRRLAAEHRASAHPDLVPSKRKRNRSMAQQVKDRDERRKAEAASRQREADAAPAGEGLAQDGPSEPVSAALSDGRARKGRWTYDTALQALQALSERLGRAPSHKDIEFAEGVPSSGTIIKHFGSLTKLQVMLGYEPHGTGRPRSEPDDKRRWTRWTRDLAIERAQDACVKLGRTPQQREAPTYHLPSAATARELFGSWNGYMHAAGLEVNGARPILEPVVREGESARTPEALAATDTGAAEAVRQPLNDDARQAAVNKIVEGLLELVDAVVSAA